jgi:hypothetical protein
MSLVDRRGFVKCGSAMTAAVALADHGIAESASSGGWIDAHVHVWTPDTDRYPLDKQFKIADMQPASFTAAELLQHSRSAGTIVICGR